MILLIEILDLSFTSDYLLTKQSINIHLTSNKNWHIHWIMEQHQISLVFQEPLIIHIRIVCNSHRIHYRNVDMLGRSEDLARQCSQQLKFQMPFLWTGQSLPGALIFFFPLLIHFYGRRQHQLSWSSSLSWDTESPYTEKDHFMRHRKSTHS